MTIALTVISALTFYLFPILLGRAAVVLVKRDYLTRLPVFAMFGIGSLLLYALALGSSGLAQGVSYTPTPADVQLWAIVLTILVALINLTHFLRNRIQANRRGACQAFFSPYAGHPHNQNALLHGSILFGLSLVVFALWKWDSPYPMPLTWDLHEHQTLANIIAQGNLSFVTSRLSDTFQFNGYSSLFHVLLAFPQALLKPDMLGFWWLVEYFHFATTIAVSYALGKAVTKNGSIGLLTGLISAFVYESSVAYTSLSLMPQTLAAVAGIATIAYMINQHQNQEKMDRLIVASGLLCTVLTHYVIGAAVLLVLLGVFLFGKRHRFIRDGGDLTLFVLVPVGAFVILSILSSLPTVRALNAGEATYFSQGVLEKLTLIRTFYGYSLLALFPFGAYSILRQKQEIPRLTLLAAILILALVLSPFPYALKLYTVGRFAVHIVIAIGLWQLVARITNKVLRRMAVVVFAVSLSLVFLVNTIQWKDETRDNGIATQVGADEVSAAVYLKATYAGQPVILLSDPATQHVLESLSGVNSQGGAYMNRATRAILGSIPTLTDHDGLVARLGQVKDTTLATNPTTVLFAISGRSMEWQKLTPEDKLSIAVNIWSPRTLSFDDWKAIRNLKAQLGLEEVYQNNSLVIYAIPIPQGVPL